jgi:hypothetical protein
MLENIDPQGSGRKIFKQLTQRYPKNIVEVGVEAYKTRKKWMEIHIQI